MEEEDSRIQEEKKDDVDLIQSQSLPFFEDSRRMQEEMYKDDIDEDLRQSQSLLLFEDSRKQVEMKNEDEQDAPGYPFFFGEDEQDDQDFIESESPNSESLLVQFARIRRYVKRKWIIAGSCFRMRNPGGQ